MNCELDQQRTVKVPLISDGGAEERAEEADGMKENRRWNNLGVSQMTIGMVFFVSDCLLVQSEAGDRVLCSYGVRTKSGIWGGIVFFLAGSTLLLWRRHERMRKESLSGKSRYNVRISSCKSEITSSKGETDSTKANRVRPVAALASSVLALCTSVVIFLLNLMDADRNSTPWAGQHDPRPSSVDVSFAFEVVLSVLAPIEGLLSAASVANFCKELGVGCEEDREVVGYSMLSTCGSVTAVALGSYEIDSALRHIDRMKDIGNMDVPDRRSLLDFYGAVADAAVAMVAAAGIHALLSIAVFVICCSIGDQTGSDDDDDDDALGRVYVERDQVEEKREKEKLHGKNDGLVMTAICSLSVVATCAGAALLALGVYSTRLSLGPSSSTADDSDNGDNSDFADETYYYYYHRETAEAVEKMKEAGLELAEVARTFGTVVACLAVAGVASSVASVVNCLERWQQRRQQQ